MTRKVDELGRIVLPAQQREELGIREGSELEVCLREGSFVLTPKQRCCKLCGSLEGVREYTAGRRCHPVCDSCAALIRE